VGDASGRLQEVMEAHIAGSLALTRGRITDWDVVNEVVADPDVLPDQDLRDSIWHRAIGDRYLDIAFQAARAADPGARLVLNEYGIEASWARADEKRARLMRALRGMLSRGVPVQAVGIQAHMPLDQPFAPAPFAAFLRELRGMGLDVLLTELDVIEPEGATLREEDIPARDAAVAERGLCRRVHRARRGLPHGADLGPRGSLLMAQPVAAGAAAGWRDRPGPAARRRRHAQADVARPGAGLRGAVRSAVTMGGPPGPGLGSPEASHAGLIPTEPTGNGPAGD
jgi:endo-1,4-beta-xylanase